MVILREQEILRESKVFTKLKDDILFPKIDLSKSP